MELERELVFLKDQQENDSEILSSASNDSTSNKKLKRILHNMKISKEELIKNFIIINFLKSNVALKDFMNDLEKNLIHCALLISMGHQRKTASLLGVKPTALNEKIKKFKLKNIKSYKSDIDKNLLMELMTVFYGIDIQ
jgi:DNA-binding NtrC family response regulator